MGLIPIQTYLVCSICSFRAYPREHHTKVTLLHVPLTIEGIIFFKEREKYIRVITRLHSKSSIAKHNINNYVGLIHGNGKSCCNLEYRDLHLSEAPLDYQDNLRL
ncbi:hypothetical protein CIPAW_14G040700 [Carya illinoinensis]|uniref:Uncharacterized protein n=1 Tax=Carya illinoinensis TaxID=32201 RepID=A0A8T1NIT2_CARIL|nr:hypothetical protein CIPAW_14G040700 [Carya illinoinensis]KAG6677770.1 hypothetical protein I3842_14G042800 [Carya illinoinensis]